MSSLSLVHLPWKNVCILGYSNLVGNTIFHWKCAKFGTIKIHYCKIFLCNVCMFIFSIHILSYVLRMPVYSGPICLLITLHVESKWLPKGSPSDSPNGVRHDSPRESIHFDSPWESSDSPNGVKFDIESTFRWTPFGESPGLPFGFQCRYEMWYGEWWLITIMCVTFAQKDFLD